MKRHFLRRILATLFLMMLASTVRAEELALLDFSQVQDWFYRNPNQFTSTGDPFIMRLKGKYYLYTTGSSHFPCYITSSVDGFSTEDRKKALKNVPWAYKNYWAPQVYAYNDEYVMVYSCGTNAKNTMHAIGIAFSDTPQGPFVPMDEPLLQEPQGCIDASLFFEDDGTPYLVYCRDFDTRSRIYQSRVCIVQLSKDLCSVIGTPVELTVGQQLWEMYTNERTLNEGPVILKNDGAYYLYYSANNTSQVNYGVGVAVSDNLMGPYEKYDENPILESKTNSKGKYLIAGPGHVSFFSAGNELFAVYHEREFKNGKPGSRYLCIDRSGWHWDGTAYISGPTTEWQLKPLEDLGLYNAMKLADGPELLTDGDICVAESSAGYVWSGKEVEFTWQEPVNAALLQIYPALGYNGKATVTINGELTTNISFSKCAALPGDSVILPFAEKVQIYSLQITFPKTASIGEVILAAQ